MNKQHLLRHIRNKHASKWTCSLCKSVFNREDNFLYHQRTCEFKVNGKRPADDQIGAGNAKKLKTDVTWEYKALDHALEGYSVDLFSKEQSPENILDILRDGVDGFESTIIDELSKKVALKVSIALHVNFHQSVDPSFVTNPPAVFNTKPVEVYEKSFIEQILA